MNNETIFFQSNPRTALDLLAQRAFILFVLPLPRHIVWRLVYLHGVADYVFGGFFDDLHGLSYRDGHSLRLGSNLSCLIGCLSCFL